MNRSSVPQSHRLELYPMAVLAVLVGGACALGIGATPVSVETPAPSSVGVSYTVTEPPPWPTP